MERTFATDVSIAFGVDYNDACQTKVWAKSLGKPFTPPGFCEPPFVVRADSANNRALSNFCRGARASLSGRRVYFWKHPALLSNGLEDRTMHQRLRWVLICLAIVGLIVAGLYESATHVGR